MKTTKKDFDQFKEGFNAIVEMFGLYEYRVTFSCEELDDVFANIYVDEEGKVAHVKFCSSVGTESVDVFNPFMHGVHEGLHLFLSRIEWVGKRRYVTPIDFDEESEKLARKIQHSMVEKIDSYLEIYKKS